MKCRSTHGTGEVGITHGVLEESYKHHFLLSQRLDELCNPTSACSMIGLTVQLQAKCNVDPSSLCWLSMELPPLYFQSGNLAFHSYKAM